MSLKAFLAAVRGYREKVGGGDGDAATPMTRAEFEALEAQVEAEAAAPPAEATTNG